jgi:hypothetical protein
MKRLFPGSLLAFAIAIGAVGLDAAPGAAQGSCLSPGEARRAVASGEAMRLGEIAGMLDGDIVSAELCESGRRLVYQLAVIRGGGRVVTVTVDARSGAVLR